MNKLILNFDDVIVHSEHGDTETIFRIPRSYKYHTDKENKIDILAISHPSLQTQMIDDKSTEWEVLKVLLEDKLNLMDVQLDGCIYTTVYGKPGWRIIPSELINVENTQKMTWKELNKTYLRNAGVFPYKGRSDDDSGWATDKNPSLSDYENSPVKEVLNVLSQMDFPEDLSAFGEHLYNHCINEYCIAESIEDDSGKYMNDITMTNLFNNINKNKLVNVEVPEEYKIV